jgi:hypothetical protein
MAKSSKSEEKIEKAVDQVMELVDKLGGTTCMTKSEAREFYQGVFDALDMRKDALGDD